nr:MAG TPA: hypothetical protein [Caudoviricetes sp.]
MLIILMTLNIFTGGIGLILCLISTTIQLLILRNYRQY